MWFEIFTDFGGLLWWILIKFCKTDLDNEQSENNWSRNLIFLIALGMLIAFFAINFFQ